MDAFELNKIAGAILGTLLVVVAVSIVSNMIFYAPTPETPGYIIAVAEPEPDEPAPAEPEVTLAELLAVADADAGQATARPCAACHTFEEGGAHRAGPNLWDVVSRPIASVDFRFSDALQALGAEDRVWDYEHLDGYLENPRGYAPGTTMAFPGVRDDQSRANLIAYLRTLSDDPAPLPEPEPRPEPDVAVTEPPPAEPEEPVADASPAVAMMAEVDPADGQAVARRCMACHTFDEGQPHRAGPNLWDKVNAPIAAREGFRYSSAMQQFAEEHGEWDLMTLDAFLEDPRGTVPGTTMVFPGVPNVNDRAALLAYLRTLSDDPAPLPVPGGEGQPQQ